MRPILISCCLAACVAARLTGATASGGAIDPDTELCDLRDAAAADMQANHAQLFAAVDADHDGRIDDGEWEHIALHHHAWLKTHHPRLFARIDTDNDGKIEAREAAVARRVWAHHHPHANPPGPVGGPGRGNPPGPIGGPGGGHRNPPGPVGGPGRGRP